MHRGADGDRTVQEDADRGAGRQGALKAGDGGAHAIDHIDRIRVRLSQHGQDQRAAAIGPTRHTLILHAISHLGDLVQAHRCRGAAGDDEIAEGRGILRLVIGAQGQLLAVAGQQADRRIGIGRRDGLADAVKSQAHRGDAVRVEPHAHGIELLAIGLHLGHALHARQRGGDDGAGDVIEPVERRVAAR